MTLNSFLIVLGSLNLSRKRTTTPAIIATTTTTTTEKPVPILLSETRLAVKDIPVNNHNPSTPIRNRPLRPSSVITVVQPHTLPPTELIGDRIKPPDTIKSASIKVLDAPSHLKTTIKHNKIIVLQKRQDQPLIPTSGKKQTTIYTTTVPSTIFQTTEMPEMGNFSVAPVMDVWSNIPIPSTPAWATSQSKPAKGGSKPVARPTSVAQSPVVPHLPFMSFITSLLQPLLTRPLTSSTVNSGMQGIKAMQGFLRNSLLGAMFCFLPSAFIALSLTTTQRGKKQIFLYCLRYCK